MDKPQNVISLILPNSVYLSQRNNVNALSEKREKEPSNQCMVAAYGEWTIPFGYFAKIEKWISQFNKETIEETIYKIVQSRVNDLNKPINEEIEKLKSQKPIPLARIESLKSQLTNRYYSIHFNWMFNQILKEYNWRMKSEPAKIERIKSILDSGQAVICGTNIKAFLPGATGHIQTFVGHYTDAKENLLGLISNDPYGDCESFYKNQNGENRYYSLETMKKLLSPCSQGDVRLMIYAEKIK
jgi:hypothetical protein